MTCKRKAGFLYMFGALVCALNISGCASTAERVQNATAAAAAQPVAAVSCLPLVSYSAAQQRALASALDALPATSPLIQAFTDYAALRAADRACLAQTTR